MGRRGPARGRDRRLRREQRPQPQRLQDRASPPRKTNFRQLGTDLGQAITAASGKSNSQLASEFTTLSQRATASAAGLRKLNPPSKYRSQNSSLAADFDTVASDMKAIATAASTNNASAARSESAKLVQDAAQLKSVDVSLSSALGLPTQ